MLGLQIIFLENIFLMGIFSRKLLVWKNGESEKPRKPNSGPNRNPVSRMARDRVVSYHVVFCRPVPWSSTAGDGERGLSVHPGPHVAGGRLGGVPQTTAPLDPTRSPTPLLHPGKDLKISNPHSSPR